MSTRSYHERWPENVRGKYYVDQQCLDCAFCADLAPGHFSRNEASGYYFVSRQPASAEEVARLEEAVAGCPCEAIYADGDRIDWTLGIVSRIDSEEIRKQKIDQKECPHCSNQSATTKPWWKFWK
jgi:ferredoxin